MKLIPIDQLPAAIKEKRTPVLLYERSKWLNGRFFIGKWSASLYPDWSGWEDERGDGYDDEVTHFALLPDEPELTAEQRAVREHDQAEEDKLNATLAERSEGLWARDGYAPIVPPFNAYCRELGNPLVEVLATDEPTQ